MSPVISIMDPYVEALIWTLDGINFVDISADVISTSASYGISNNTPADRVATTGRLQFRLNNSTGKYTPGMPGSLSYFTKGGWIFLVFEDVNNVDYHKFCGHIDNISINVEDETVDVLALDWMDYAAIFPIVIPTILYNQKIEDVVPVIVATMPVRQRPT